MDKDRDHIHQLFDELEEALRIAARSEAALEDFTLGQPAATTSGTYVDLDRAIDAAEARDALETERQELAAAVNSARDKILLDSLNLAEALGMAEHTTLRIVRKEKKQTIEVKKLAGFVAEATLLPDPVTDPPQPEQ